MARSPVATTVSIVVVLAFTIAALSASLSASAATPTTYVVQSGDTLYGIGLKFGIPWQSIAQANNIRPPYLIYVGETLVISSGGSSTSCNSATQPINYTVKSGDTLYGIGQNFGVAWQSIASANNIASPYTIFVGEQLTIPSGVGASCSTTTAASSSSTTITTPSSGSVYYTVKPGDYLYLIGEEFGVPWESIAAANGISPPYALYAGEVLLIPLETSITTTSSTTTFSTTTITTSTTETSSSTCPAPSPPLVTSGRNVGPQLTSLSPGGKYVILRFDDSFQDQWVNALPILEQYHFKAVFLAVTGAITNQGLNYSSGDGWVNLSWQELQWLYNNGFEISDHSMTHPDLTALSCSGLYTEVYQSRQMLFQNGMTYIPSLSLPFGVGAGNSTVMSYIAASGFAHAYTDDQDASTAITNYNYVHTQWYEIDAANTESLAYFKAVVDQASGSNIVGIFMHHVDDHVAGTSYYVNVTNFQNDMAYLAENGFTVIVPSQLPQY